MPSNLLVLPLIAGYLFIHLCNRFRFRAQSLDGYRLLIESAIAGAILLVLARLSTIILHSTPLAAWWRSVAPNVPYLGTATISLAIALVLPVIDNRRPRLGLARKSARWVLTRRSRIIRPVRVIVKRLLRAYEENRQNALDKEIRLHGNALMRLFNDAGSRGMLIAITLNSRKWYVGYLVENVSLEPRETHFQILPIFSGYRDKDTLDAVRVIDYRDVYSAYMNDEGEKEGDLSIFSLAIPMAAVQDARCFDVDVYAAHFHAKDAPAAANANE